MAGRKKSTTIIIDGNSYPIITDEGASYVQALAELCDAKLRKAAEDFPGLGTKHRYTLALLDTADQYLRLKQEYDAMKREIDNLTSGNWE